MRYYLSYGSNMVVDQMKIRCPDAKLLSKEYLKGYKLEFKKVKNGIYLDMVKSLSFNSKVPVFIWEVSLQDEKNLDEYEDLGDSYIKKEIDCSLGKAFVYLVNEKYKELGFPKDEYLLPILNTYIENGFDKNILLRQFKGED